MTSRTLSSAVKRARSAVVVAALLVSLAACSGAGAQSTPSPTAETLSPSATSTPTPTPTPTPSYKPADASGKAQNVPVPVLPEVAKAETKEGLEAFARYWFQLLSYGYETGDLAPLSTVTAPGCDACEKAKSVITSWHSEGRWLIGGKITTPSVSSNFLKDADASYQVVVQSHQTPLTYVRADSSIARSDPQPDDKGNLLFIRYSGGLWTLVNVGRIVG